MAFESAKTKKSIGRSRISKALELGLVSSVGEFEQKTNAGYDLCFSCRQWKLVDEFYWDNKSKGIRHHTCGKCVYASRKNNQTSVQRLLYQYRQNANFRGYDFDLTLEDFESLKDKVCFYCGVDQKLGFDRIDNSIGYIASNVVPCCWSCNHMKYKSSKEEWFEHIKKVLEYNGFEIHYGDTNA